MPEEQYINIDSLDTVDLDSATFTRARYGYKRWRIKLSGLMIDNEEAYVISKIFTDFANGYDYGQIASKLNKSQKKTKQGKKWLSQNIKMILENPIYCGYIFRDGKYIKGILEPIITVELFNRCQKDDSKKISKQ